MGIKRIGGGMAVNQITEGVIWKQLLYFFFPILFGTFFQQLYNTADAVIVQKRLLEFSLKSQAVQF